MSNFKNLNAFSRAALIEFASEQYQKFPIYFLNYSFYEIQQNFYQVGISLSQTVYLGTDGFTVKLF